MILSLVDLRANKGGASICMQSTRGANHSFLSEKHESTNMLELKNMIFVRSLRICASYTMS